MAQRVYFSSRWGMLVAMLGMAVGTGNIWRFPRIAASNGGGANFVAIQNYREAGMFDSVTVLHGPVRIGTSRTAVEG